MKSRTVLKLDDLPFCIGVSENSSNPKSLPNTYPFEMIINQEIGRLEQADSKELGDILESAYTLGIEMGTPSDNTDLGLPYVDDFISFLNKHINIKGRALEIGAGTGFLSKVLIDNGWDVDSIEPGKGYSEYWKKYKVEVVNDFFPSDKIQGTYDLIVFYTVLEHLKDTTIFLNNVASFLTDDGKIALSVPDCTEEIEIGDPSIFLHEHYQYFTKGSLERTLLASGLTGRVEKSNFARSLYAIAEKRPKDLDEKLVSYDSELATFAPKVEVFRTTFQKEVARYSLRGSVGLYCPARALNLISTQHVMRFFDDNNLLHGKYYPPFEFVIESRQQLINDPVDYLIIASRTFGKKLQSELQPLLPNTIIATIDSFVE